MKEVIHGFVELLRQGGLKITPQETIDALQAVNLAGIDYLPLRATLRATMIKSQIDRALFERLFEIYFGQRDLKYPSVGDAGWDIATAGGGPSQGRQGTGSPAGELAAAIKDGHQRVLERLAQRGIENAGPLREQEFNDIPGIVRRAQVALGWFEAVHLLDQEAKQVSYQEYESWQDRWRDLNRAIISLLEDELLKFGTKGLDAVIAFESLRLKDFNLLQDEEIDQVKAYLTRLGRRLAARQGRRRQRAKRGQVYLAGTWRQALRTGGIPVQLRYRERLPDRPEFAVLCDLSGSVALFSEFMLNLVIALQERFQRVRSFAFVDEIDEISDLLPGTAPDQVVERIRREARFSISDFSNYGQVLVQFEKRYLNQFSSRATLIILGDARNNWNHPEKDLLAVIAGQFRRLIWLNPQPREYWGNEDSIIGMYAPLCSGVYECRNLRQLEEAVQKIIVPGRRCTDD